MSAEQAAFNTKGLTYRQIGAARKGSKVIVIRRDAEKDVRQWVANCIEDGIMNEQLSVITAIRYTSRIFCTTSQRVELLLACERMYELFGYISKHRLLRWYPPKLCAGVNRFIAVGWLSRTGKYHKPLSLTRAGRDVCDTYRRYHKQLHNAIPL